MNQILYPASQEGRSEDPRQKEFVRQSCDAPLDIRCCRLIPELLPKDHFEDFMGSLS